MVKLEYYVFFSYMYRMNCTSLFTSTSQIICRKLFFECDKVNVVKIIDFKIDFYLTKKVLDIHI